MISIVVPVFNEARRIENFLEQFETLKGSFELILVDGGSTDDTVKRIRAYSKTAEKKQYKERKTIKKRKNILLIRSNTGRAVQLNAGASVAHGEVLLFLHADSFLPKNAIRLIHKSIEKGAVGGGFQQAFLERRFLLRLISVRSNARARMFKIFFGDQGMFVLKKCFEKMGGFRNIPIMEDLDFSKRLKRAGKVVFIRKRVMSSARTYLAHGILKMTLIYFILMVMYHLRFSYWNISTTYAFLTQKTK